MNTQQGNNRSPRLDDPQEYALIKEMYFENDNRIKEDIDPIEQWERIISRNRNLNNNSR